MSTTVADTTNDTSFPTLYEAFHDQGPLYNTWICTAVHNILQLIGLFGNSCIVWATIAYKQLHGTCGTLLSIGAIGDILHQLSHYFLGYLMFSGKTFTDLQTCVLVNIVPVIGLSVGLLMILFIAIDRLMSIIFPAKHRTINKKIYIGIYVLITAAYCVFILLLVLEAMKKEPKTQTTCLITDAMPGGVGQTWFTICLIVNIATVVCYIVVWLTLRVKTNGSESTRKMFKSLAAITLMVFLGWAINACIQVALRALHATPITYWYTGFYAGIPVNIACSCNYFVLYAFSKDYRQAFQHQINKFASALCRKQLFTASNKEVVRTVTLAWSSATTTK